MSAERWLYMRDKLRNIRSCDRKLEMIADGHLTGSYVIQFHFDVQLYGLYEAVLMAPEDSRDGLMQDFCEVFDKSKHREVYLPDAQTIERIERAGKIVAKTVATPWRPESVWRMQEHMIRNITFTRATEEVFERTLPPHVSHAYITKAKQQDLYSAVRDAPYAYREQLCARLIKLHDIPLPPEPKAKTHHIAQGTPARPRDRVLVIDKAGNAWTWDLGWGRVKESGDWLEPHKRRLGHVEFQRVITPADPDDFRRTSFHYTRPWGQWRRGTGPVAHELFGNGNMIITDGVHAVVNFADGIKREVMLANLHNIGVRIPQKPGDKPAKERTPREKKTRPQMSLEELMNML